MKNQHLISILCIIFISIGIYVNTLGNGFILDDYGTIVDNAFIKDLRNLPKLFDPNYFQLSDEMTYRPFVTVTYFIDYQLYDLKPWGYHLTNIILHTANGILLYIIAILFLEFNSFKALLCALLFVTHPVLTEAVNCASFREDLLVFFFYMGAFNLYLIARSNIYSQYKHTLYFISCILYFLGLLSKEMALTFPIAIYCYEWVYSIKNKGGCSYLFNTYNIGYIAVTLGYIYLRFYHFVNHDPLIVVYTPAWEFSEKLLTVPWLLISYTKIAFFAVSLSTDHVITPVNLTSSTLFIVPSFAITFLAILVFLTKNRDILFGAVFFLITLIPVANIVPLTMPFAERYLYLPMAGFAIICASLLFSFKIRYKIFNLMLSLLLGILCLSVINRNTVWSDDLLFWSDAVIKMPKSARAHHNLGVTYFSRGRLIEAIQEARTAIWLNPFDPRYHTTLGIAYAEAGNIEEAIEEFQTTMRISPKDPDAHYNLGVIYLKKGLENQGRAEFEKTIELDPGYSKAINTLELLKEKK